MNPEPHISLVAVGRNDDYGGDFRSRLQAFATWSVKQLTLNEIHSEVIFVNYNPVDDQPIEKFINWPKSNKWVTVKVITVPISVHHQALKEFGTKDVPVLEYVAKNIGIRRAKGQFILSMNPDILISKEIFYQFKNLHASSFYRANRVDYEGSSDLDLDLYQQLRKSVRTIWFKGSHTNVSGFSIKKYKMFWFLKNLQNLWKRNTVYFEWILKRINVTTYHHNMQFKYHSNACGDFMLMSREKWHELRGYKERSFIALHTDALMIVQAVFSGLEEQIFESPIYHKQHLRRFDAHNRLTEDQIKVYHQYNDDIETMKQNGKAIIYNSDDWGYSHLDFPEKIV